MYRNGVTRDKIIGKCEGKNEKKNGERAILDRDASKDKNTAERKENKGNTSRKKSTLQTKRIEQAG